MAPVNCPLSIRPSPRHSVRMKESIKATASAVGWALGIAALLLIAFLLIWGIAWVSDKVLPTLNLIMEILLGVLLVVGLPFLFSRKTRGYVGVGFVWWSYLCGLSLWLLCLLVCLNLWGVVAAVIGLCVVGVGVLPVAVLAALFKGEWLLLSAILFQLALTFGARFAGFFLASKSILSEGGICE